MSQYKRNQVEEAIARIVEGRPEPSSELRTRLKRLLDADRKLKHNKKSLDPEEANFAFYSEEAPGKGVEVWFSDYDAFALLMGLRILQSGRPQGFAVSVLRRARPKLEKEHEQILRRGRARQLDPDVIRKKVKAGDVNVDVEEAVFLVLGFRPKSEEPAIAIFRNSGEMFRFVMREAGSSFSHFELMGPAQLLAEQLAKAEPRKRGRA